MGKGRRRARHAPPAGAGPTLSSKPLPPLPDGSPGEIGLVMLGFRVRETFPELWCSADCALKGPHLVTDLRYDCEGALLLPRGLLMLQHPTSRPTIE